MVPTIIYRKAANWVDRGESPIPTLRRVLARFSGRFDESDDAWLDEHAATMGMVAADATEVHIAAYLRSVERMPELDVVRVLRRDDPSERQRDE